ncbi:MAG: kinase [Thermodesulfovibrio sp.]|nr:kinase [Thermodesulfovibrio sp.]
MIITRTPFRISFFGGGTDYPVWYRENGGSVLSTTIDKYCYITCRRLPSFFEFKHWIVYSRQEYVSSIDEIQHPAVRETFRFMNIAEGLSVHHDGDLPARSGLGSSSSFTVGLLNTLYAWEGKMVSKEQLAREAIHIEHAMIREDVGSQDQVAAAFGGFNKITFTQDGLFSVDTIIINRTRLELLQNHLMLFFTGFSRTASEIAREQIKATPQKKNELLIMSEMVDESISLLHSTTADIADFGKLMHESWKLKRSLTDKISTRHIDEIYETAYSAGAYGGKLLGAGGGGFMLICARPEDQPAIREKLSSLLMVPFRFENYGSQVIVYQPEPEGRY